MENLLMSIVVAIFLAVGLSLVLLYPALSARAEHGRMTKSVGQNATVKNGPREIRNYTASEVAKHNSESDCWLIVKNKVDIQVYDVTPYVEEHPGSSSILNNAGGENTKAMFGPQHPAWAHQRLLDFYIGDLVD